MRKFIALVLCLGVFEAHTTAPARAQGKSATKARTSSIDTAREPKTKWEAFLESPSMFANVEPLLENDRVLKVLGLVDKTLEEKDVNPQHRASALWVGVRLESGRAIREKNLKKRENAARAALKYLGDLRACLRDFPLQVLESNAAKQEDRIYLWNQAMSEFASYEADARVALGANEAEFDGEDPQTRASLWVLKEFGPYNKDESSNNAQLMQKKSEQFREVERLAKQAVAVRIQASVALQKVYGWPPIEVVATGPASSRDGSTQPGAQNQSLKKKVLAEPGAFAAKGSLNRLSRQEASALAYDASHELDASIVELMRVTASGAAEGVVDKYARTREALDWGLGVSLFTPNGQNPQVLNTLITRFHHRALWGNGLNWDLPALTLWPSLTKPLDGPNVGSVQEEVRKWIVANADATKNLLGRQFQWPGGFSHAEMLAAKSNLRRIAYGVASGQIKSGELEPALAFVTETDRNGVRQFKAKSSVDDLRKALDAYKALADQKAISTEAFVSPIELEFVAVQQSKEKPEQWRLARWPERRAKLQAGWDATRKQALVDQRLSPEDNSALSGPQYVSLASRRLYDLRAQINRLRRDPRLLGSDGRKPDESGILRDGEFGRIRLFPSIDPDYLLGFAPEEERLNLFRDAMADLYVELTDGQEPHHPRAASQQLADFFFLMWTIDTLTSSTRDNRPPWAQGFLDRRIAELEPLKADAASGSTTKSVAPKKEEMP